MADTTPDRVAAYLAEARARFSSVNYAIATESPRQLSVAVASTSDVPRLLAAIEAALKLADGWDENAPAVPYIDREAAACAVRGTIAAALLCEENDRA